MSKQRTFFIFLIMLTFFLSSCGKEEKPHDVYYPMPLETKDEEPIVVKNRKITEELQFGECVFKGNVKKFEIICKKPIFKIEIERTDQQIQKEGRSLKKLSEYIIQGSFDSGIEIIPIVIIHNDNRKSRIRIDTFDYEKLHRGPPARYKFGFCEIASFFLEFLNVECTKKISKVEILYDDTSNEIKLMNKEEKSAWFYFTRGIRSKVNIIFSHDDGTKSQLDLNPSPFIFFPHL